MFITRYAEVSISLRRLKIGSPALRPLCDIAIVNTQQQWQLQEMINVVAEALFESKKGKMSKNLCFAISHNDFKNTFRISAYSMLLAEKMEEIFNYLAQRYQRLRPGQKLPEVLTGGIQQSFF